MTKLEIRSGEYQTLVLRFSGFFRFSSLVIGHYFPSVGPMANRWLRVAM